MTTTRLVPRAECLVCDWTPDLEAKASVDRQVEKHTQQVGHATRSGANPEVRR